MSEPIMTPIDSTALKPEELEIHTIPDKFYGAALKAQVVTEKKQAPSLPAESTAHPTKRHWPIVAAIGGLLLVIGGGFVYFNRNLLFGGAVQTPLPPTVLVETPKPEPLPIPSIPKNVAATSTNPQSVVLSWTDASENESGFRIERHDGNGQFASLTSLPQNSTSFLDSSVQPKKTYVYRVRALNTSGESEPSSDASVQTPDLPTPPPERPQLPPAGLDTDSDGLTDVEEALYGTDTRVPDSDNDGFLDGNEVFHLYNPAAKSSVRLSDSGLVKTVQSSGGWVMNVPAAWVSTIDAADGSRATIDSRHGETFTVTVEDNVGSKPVIDWYLERHPGMTSTQILQYRSKKGYVGIIGADLLSTYIPWASKVFVFTYHLNGQPFINDRTTYSMMLNSLILNGLSQEGVTTSSALLPFEPSATSSGEVSQPVPVEAPVAPLPVPPSPTEVLTPSTSSSTP